MNVIFDLGKVLIDWDPRHLYRKIFTDPDKMEWFLSHVCNHEWNLEQDRGGRFYDAAKKLAAEHPDLSSEILAFDTRWHEMVSGEIAGSVDILEVLHKNSVPLYAITNWNQEKFSETKLRFPFLNLFRDIVVSGAEGMIKPDAAIYRLCLDRNSLVASDCLFIDDSETNVRGAEAVGMLAHHFTSPAKLRSELRQRQLL